MLEHFAIIIANEEEFANAEAVARERSRAVRATRRDRALATDDVRPLLALIDN